MKSCGLVRGVWLFLLVLAPRLVDQELEVLLLLVHYFDLQAIHFLCFIRGVVGLRLLFLCWGPGCVHSIRHLLFLVTITAWTLLFLLFLFLKDDMLDFECLLLVYTVISWSWCNWVLFRMSLCGFFQMQLNSFLFACKSCRWCLAGVNLSWLKFCCHSVWAFLTADAPSCFIFLYRQL